MYYKAIRLSLIVATIHLHVSGSYGSNPADVARVITIDSSGLGGGDINADASVFKAFPSDGVEVKPVNFPAGRGKVRIATTGAANAAGFGWEMAEGRSVEVGFDLPANAKDIEVVLSVGTLLKAGGTCLGVQVNSEKPESLALPRPGSFEVIRLTRNQLSAATPGRRNKLYIDSRDGTFYLQSVYIRYALPLPTIVHEQDPDKHVVLLSPLSDLVIGDDDRHIDVRWRTYNCSDDRLSFYWKANGSSLQKIQGAFGLTVNNDRSGYFAWKLPSKLKGKIEIVAKLESASAFSTRLDQLIKKLEKGGAVVVEKQAMRGALSGNVMMLTDRAVTTTDVELISEMNLDGINFVNCSYASVSDIDGLKQLGFKYCGVSRCNVVKAPAWCDLVAQMEFLEWLDVDLSTLPEDWMAKCRISGRKLKGLSLVGVSCPGRSQSYLKENEVLELSKQGDLRVLDICGMNNSVGTLGSLHQLSGLEWFGMSHIHPPGNSFIEFGTGFKELRTLALPYCPGATAECYIANITSSKMPFLKECFIQSASLDDGQLRALVSANPLLELLVTQKGYITCKNGKIVRTVFR